MKLPFNVLFGGNFKKGVQYTIKVCVKLAGKRINQSETPLKMTFQNLSVLSSYYYY